MTMNSAEFAAYLAGCPSPAGSRLLSVPAVTDLWLPWASEHFGALAELAGVDRDAESLGDIVPFYVVFASHYMLHDIVADAHVNDRHGLGGAPQDNLFTATVASADALSLAHWIFEARVLRWLETTDVKYARERLAVRLGERNDALRIERARKTGWDPPNGADRRSAIGRNNAPLFAFEILSLSVRGPVNPLAQEAVEDLLYLIQLGDDLSDWVYDFEDGNHTMFLRSCVHAGLIPDTADFGGFERAIYLSGFYERNLADYICKMDALRSRFSNLGIPEDLAVNYIDSARGRALGLLRAAVDTKLKHLKDVA